MTAPTRAYGAAAANLVFVLGGLGET